MHTHRIARGLLAPLFLAPVCALAAAPVITTFVALREGYDSNVYMQRAGPRGNQETLFTTLQTGVSWALKTADGLAVTASYTPEFTAYHSASVENFAAHKFALAASGKTPGLTWDTTQALTWIDGDNFSPTFTGQGGAPALGGVPLRDRRDAIVYRGAAKAVIPVSFGFVRPVASLYNHDFRTAQFVRTGYQNYVDRSDLGLGADLGYAVNKTLTVIAGYRHGWQNQGATPGNTIQYDNHYDRFLAGIEGTPVKGLKLALLAGPDTRDYTGTVPATFRNPTRVFVDGSATLTVGATDTVTLTVKRFEQPGFGGASVYDDSTYETVWKHTLSPRLATTVTARALNWDFEYPVNRNEWWYAGVFAVSYAPKKQLTLDAALTVDSVESTVVATAGREARRALVSIGAKYVF